MEQLDTFLRAEIEPLQYAVFFGGLVILGALETKFERSLGRPERAGRWPANWTLTVLNILILGALPVTGVLVADVVREAGYGLFNWLPVNPIIALVAGFLIRSLVSWAVHLAMHKVPLLWQVHRVHHSDTFLDISTTVRFHPLEYVVNLTAVLIAVLMFGISPVTLMLYELFDAGMAVFTHANIRMPRVLERSLRLVLVTPDMHRIHHSSFQPETDSNYGATLSLWDRMFGTYRDKEPESLARMQIGLGELQDRRSKSLWWLLTLPFRPRRLQPIEQEQNGGRREGDGSG